MKRMSGSVFLPLLLLLLFLTTPLEGQTGRELRNPTPKEIIAQLLLRRAHKATHNPPTPLAPSFVPPAPTSSPLIDPEVDQGGGGGGGGGGGFGGGGGRVEEEDVAALTNLIVDEACTGSGCGSADEFKERWSMPLMKLGNKRYYLGIFFKANWFKALQYCRFHGMHLASVESLRENTRIENYIKDAGLGHEHFWTSGTDQGEEGNFFWMSNGQPVTYTNWNAGEPNNFQYENGEMEHCLELWNRDGKGLKWNDSPCSFETYFICEVE
ncbi:mannose-binding protein C-like isoform X2 [Eriocheir sinensis]|uniref:mannose-binding protein C-like isoform X2 n=1 Tax=Eriocheir sinensis TaxID=95602 RepID=UPI0021C5FF81|nr:mannose-binding protein C-like isoform X2 [Eriocheir sinensis]